MGDVALFKNVRDDYKRAIAPRLEPRFFNKGEAIVTEGEVGDAMYIVRQGSVSVLLTEPMLGLEMEVARLRTGQVFGEMSMLTAEPRSATVRAVDPTHALVLSRETFHQIAAKIPEVAIAVAQVLAERVSQLNKERGSQLVDISRLRSDPEVYRMVPSRILEAHRMIPMSIDGGTLTVACVDPRNLAGLDEIKRLMRGVEIRAVGITEPEYKNFLEKNKVVPGPGNTMKMKAFRPVAIAWESDSDKDGPSDPALGDKVKLLLDQIVGEGIDREASDIHFEPERDEVVIRYRMSGRLVKRPGNIPRSLLRPLVSRIKILAELDISEKRLPQDGRIGLKASGRMLDLRVSSLPTNDGEKVVLRILDSANALQPLERLVLAEKVCRVVNQLVMRPHGVVYVCGPTGSGKTTTLYSALGVRRNEHTNITTVEDPVEYSIPGITQVSVRSEIGLTFASILRSVLRQDPNVILVGETRDKETGKLVLEAGLTGHMVLTSLHTNDALGTIQRLREMELENFAIAASLVGVISQRLVRRLCPACAVESQLTPALHDQLTRVDVVPKEFVGKIKRAVGCDSCAGTGYRGRVGCYEILVADEALRTEIANGASTHALKATASKGAYVPMARYSNYLLMAGLTTPDEIISIHAGS